MALEFRRLNSSKVIDTQFTIRFLDIWYMVYGILLDCKLHIVYYYMLHN